MTKGDSWLAGHRNQNRSIKSTLCALHTNTFPYIREIIEKRAEIN